MIPTQASILPTVSLPNNTGIDLFARPYPDNYNCYELKCNDLKLELRLHLGKGLRKYKGKLEVVKRKDTGMYLRYIYSFRECP